MLSSSDRRVAAQLEADLLADPAFARAVRPAIGRLQALSFPVLVGVGPNGSPSAVAWAAAEAASMGCPLRVVHAMQPPVAAADLYGVVPVQPWLDGQRRSAAGLLDAAIGEARRAAPGLDVSGSLVQGAPQHALYRESRRARLLVLGATRRSRPTLGELLRGTLPIRLTASAHCPVAVVRTAPPGTARAGRVVVGVDGTAGSDAAIGFAFRAARRHAVGLTAVYGWTADCPADLEAISAPLTTTIAGARALVDAALGPWRPSYPDVDVDVEIVRRDPATALIGDSSSAALVVVGSRGRGRAMGAAFGSVSQAVLAGAAGPVAVIRHERHHPYTPAPRAG